MGALFSVIGQGRTNDMTTIRPNATFQEIEKKTQFQKSFSDQNLKENGDLRRGMR